MISAIILSHNNESIIERCIKSVSWCKEIIVVDDESTDKTRDVAKKLGATVYTRPLAGDFASQRNFGLEKATGDWILFVDSDEVVTPELAHEISEATNDTHVAGFRFRRTDNFLGSWLMHGETAAVRLVRLARKRAGTWMRPVHEVWQVPGHIHTLTHPLVHFPHQSIASFLRDINAYTTQNAKHLYDSGVRANYFSIVAYPKAKFIKHYFLQRGFLDGTAGMVMALMMSFHSFLTRAKLYMIERSDGSLTK